MAVNLSSWKNKFLYTTLNINFTLRTPVEAWAGAVYTGVCSTYQNGVEMQARLVRG